VTRQRKSTQESSPVAIKNIMIGNCRANSTLVSFPHDAVPRATPRRLPLLQGLLQVHP
jgi:hypothetical protein